MRTSVLSDEISQDLGIAVDTAVEFGFDGLEIRSVDGCPPHELEDAALRDIRRALADAGLAISAFCPPALKVRLPQSASDRASAARIVQRAVEQAKLLDTEHVRIFSFLRTGNEPEPDRAAAEARLVLAAVEVPQGVQLVLETGTRSNTPTVATAARFLQVLGAADMGILWDPGNSAFSGIAPRPFPVDFAVAPQRIVHVHVKDPQATERYVRLGDGDLPWPEILRGLADRKYNGWLTLETHWRHDRDLSPSERDEPWGYGVSAGGLEASRECMAILRTWLAGLS